MISIQPLCKDYLDQVASLEADCFSQPWSKNTLSAQLDQSSVLFFVALCDGTVCGYASMNCLFETGYINNIAVAPKFRRRGVAKLLLAELEARAAEKGVLTTTLEVRASNKPALALYQQLDYHEIGRRPRFYEKPAEDAILMEKTLAQPDRLS